MARSPGSCAALALAVAALAVAGCHKRTEMILSVQTGGVRIPDDVAKLRFIASDHMPDNPDLKNEDVWSQDVALCTPTLTTGCYQLPVTALLFPGDKHPKDVVRVEVDALDASGKPVISDAALFAFASEQTLHIDFVLYANCIGVVDCAKRDQACGPDAMCQDVGNVHAMSDLGVGMDLAGVGDMAMTPPDLTTTIDMYGCSGIDCGPGFTCVAGGCVPCGSQFQYCCPNGCEPGYTCDGTMCQSCGAPGELCCAGLMPPCTGTTCNSGTGRCDFPEPPDLSNGGMTGGGDDLSIGPTGGPPDLSP